MTKDITIMDTVKTCMFYVLLALVVWTLYRSWAAVVVSIVLCMGVAHIMHRLTE